MNVSAPQKLCHRFRAGSDLKFLINSPDVGVHGFVADADLLGNFFIEKPMAEAIEHLLFTLRKILGRLWRGAGFLKRLYDFPPDMRRHRRAATLHFMDGLD